MRIRREKGGSYPLKLRIERGDLLGGYVLGQLMLPPVRDLSRIGRELAGLDLKCQTN